MHDAEKLETQKKVWSDIARGFGDRHGIPETRQARVMQSLAEDIAKAEAAAAPQPAVK